jgi:hypothetical protein
MTSPISASHVYPLFGREHVISDTEECWCEPEVDDDGETVVIIHHPEQ